MKAIIVKVFSQHLELKKIIKIPSQNNQCSNQNSNQEPPEHISEVLPSEPNFSVTSAYWYGVLVEMVLQKIVFIRIIFTQCMVFEIWNIQYVT
jgi:hypothetical protein